MVAKTIENRSIAVAAALQYLEQVRELATKGSCQEALLENAIYSIFQLEAEQIDDIYGGIHHLQRGMQLIFNQLEATSSTGRDDEITRYFITLAALERKLMNQPQALNQLREGIESAIAQAQYFDTTHENVIHKLADIYKQVISPLGTRVIVNGEQRFLADENIACRIRVLLLAALRALVLWRQTGGSRLQLLFQRGKYIEAAGKITRHS